MSKVVADFAGIQTTLLQETDLSMHEPHHVRVECGFCSEWTGISAVTQSPPRENFTRALITGEIPVVKTTGAATTATGAAECIATQIEQ